MHPPVLLRRQLLSLVPPHLHRREEIFLGHVLLAEEKGAYQAIQH